MKIKKFFIFISFLVLFTYSNKVYASQLNETILNDLVGEYNENISESGLYESKYDNDTIYLYVGNDNNNNLVFNGLKFNILGIDTNGNIKIVLNEDNVYSTSKDYTEVIDNWYKEQFSVGDTNNIITKTILCNDLKSNLFCDNEEQRNVGLISIQEFRHTLLDNKTYLDREFNYYFWTSYYKHQYFYDAFYDKIRTTVNEKFNIYPVITLSSKTNIASGDGTLTSPYVISNTIYGDSENVVKEDKVEKLDKPKILKKEDIDLLVDNSNLNSITYEIYNNKYSIKFMKENLVSVKEFNLDIELDKFENNIYNYVDNVLKNTLYDAFYFKNLSEFPNTAITKIDVEDKFKNESALWLYFYNDETKKLEYVDNNLLVEDGYVELNINKGGQYVLTDNEITNFENENNIVIILIAFFIGILLIFGICGSILHNKIKKTDN